MDSETQKALSVLRRNGMLPEVFEAPRVHYQCGEDDQRSRCYNPKCRYAEPSHIFLPDITAINIFTDPKISSEQCNGQQIVFLVGSGTTTEVFIPENEVKDLIERWSWAKAARQ